jgi:RNA polymerase sigma factor (sigma-70 family)
LNFYTNIPGDTTTDRELVSMYRQTADLKHLSVLYQRYMDLVFGVCMKYFKESERAKDAVMDIFEELIPKLQKHEVDNFKGWLHVLARNHCLMILRAGKNVRTTEFRPEFMQSGNEIHLSAEFLEKEESYKKLENCLQLLPEEQRKAVTQFYLDKKCYKEISASTGLDWNMVRSYIQNGRRNLKICMEKKQTTLKTSARIKDIKGSL